MQTTSKTLYLATLPKDALKALLVAMFTPPPPQPIHSKHLY